MKIWIDEKVPAPEDYHWVRRIDEAIITMQGVNAAIDRAIRNNMIKSSNNTNGVSIRDMQVNEINMSADMACSKACNALRIYLEEAGRTDSCPIVTRGENVN